MRLLDAYGVDPAGHRGVVVGRSPILGRPVGMLLLARDATVSFCHSKTGNLVEFVADSDIAVAAVGRPELIRGDWIEPGALVIDAGDNPGNIGDFEYSVAAQRARLITPVPGGVGPTTMPCYWPRQSPQLKRPHRVSRRESALAAGPISGQVLASDRGATQLPVCASDAIYRRLERRRTPD
ncbi:hypothetical protein ACN27E_18325 [Mycobacterium sp. WMMD1722]|uniref:hypothetical protein n=1 Tax=Mycobacterium sp. WMMD1722 TaxID=3404117 RepID=UPI003BF60C43